MSEFLAKIKIQNLHLHRYSRSTEILFLGCGKSTERAISKVDPPRCQQTIFFFFLLHFFILYGILHADNNKKTTKFGCIRAQSLCKAVLHLLLETVVSATIPGKKRSLLEYRSNFWVFFFLFLISISSSPKTRND